MEARIEGVTGGANTWIVGDDEEVIVIDPGTDAEAVLPPSASGRSSP